MTGHKKEKPKSDNRGMTLVEVIVSLLIIALVFTPLLMTFVQATKVNVATNSEAYSSAAGENVMEEVKAKGIERYAIDYAKTLPSKSCAYVAYDSAKDIYTFVKSTDGDYRFKLYNVIQGTKIYDILVNISPTAYTGLTATATPDPSRAAGTPTPTPKYLFNDYTFADFSAFSSEKTALIYPKTSDSEFLAEAVPGKPSPTPKIYAGFDDKAVSYFMDLNEDYIEQKYIERRNAVDAENEEIKKWNKAHPENTKTLKPLPTRDRTENAATIKGTVSRTIEITVKKNDKNDDLLNIRAGNGYLVSSRVIYKADNYAGYYPAGRLEIVYEGYCNDVYFKNLESVFLIYSVQDDGFKKGGNDLKVITDGAPSALDVYVAVQVEEGTKGIDYKYPTLSLSEDIARDETDINYYSQSEINCTSMRTTDPEKSFIKESLIKNMSESSNRIFTVTVEVYSHADTEVTAFNPDLLLNTLQSTYVNDTEIK